MQFLKDFYYKLFVNSISLTKKGKLFSDMPVTGAIFIVSVGMCYNILLIWLVINTHFAKGFTDFLYFEIFKDGKYNFLVNLIFYVVLPLVLFNYYLIAYRGKYKKLFEIYPTAIKSKITIVYFFLSAFLLYIYFILVVI